MYVYSKVRKPETDSEIGKLITSRLEELKQNQAWLASQIGMTSGALNCIIKGRYKPSMRSILLISKILEIEDEELINSAKLEWGIINGTTNSKRNSSIT